ncbi:hypothetical protein NW762_005944 [Fusarium torreyae]|uniref:Uncharacterized protein n=1 Tax=Fusarium torreyae TaxID=1237075 RepID=A0A9W8S107_9HYPO|nr:hypothetical protein NW762_005944 [Fusarium torreyae]
MPSFTPLGFMREEIPWRLPTEYPECAIIRRDVASPTNQLHLGAIVRLPEGEESWIKNSDLVCDSNRDHGVEWRVVVTPKGLCWEPRIGWDELERLAATNHEPTYGTRQNSREAIIIADTNIIGASDDDRPEDSNPDYSLTYINDFGEAVLIAQPLTQAPSPSPPPADQGFRLSRPCESTLSYRPRVPSNILQTAYINTVLNWFAEQPRSAAFRALWPRVPARYFELESESEGLERIGSLRAHSRI